MAPDRRLLWMWAGVTSLAYLGFLWPSLQLAGWAAGAVAVGLMVVDWRLTRVRALPRAEIDLPDRTRAGRPTPITVRLECADGGAQQVRACLDLPDDLGGEILLEPRVIAPGEGHAVRHVLSPTLRGLRPVGPLQVGVRSALGLHWRRAVIAEERSLAVLPDPGRGAESGLTRDESLATRFGLRPRRPRGEGLEFESLREYVPGDDPRHIDWRATARSGTPIVRQYQIERNHDVVVAVETGRLMGVRIRGVSKLDHALNAMVALAHATRAAGDRMGFVAFDQEVHAFVPPIDARQAITPILDATLKIAPRPCEPVYRGLAETLGVRQKRRSLLVLLTDFVEGSASAALERYLALLARRHCVLLVALRDPLLCTFDDPAPRLDAESFYHRLVVQDLLIDREIVLARLRRLGVLTLDLHPEQVTAPVLERYLEIRSAGLL